MDDGASDVFLEEGPGDYLFARFAYLSNTAVVPVYILSTLWTVALSSAAGPAAVATGAHVAGAEASSRSMCIGLLAAALREAGLQAVRFILQMYRLSHSTTAVADRRMVIDNFSFLLPNTGLSTWIALSLIFGSLFLIALAYILAAVGFAVGITALVAELAIGEVPSEFLVASVPAVISLAVFQLLKLHRIGDLPLSTPNYALAGVIFAHVCDLQGRSVCSQATAAAAGAVFATIACNTNAPLDFFVVLFSWIRKGIYSWWNEESFVESIMSVPANAKKSTLGAALFGPPRSIGQELFGPVPMVSQSEYEAAVRAEEAELGLYPEKTQVFFSRPLGLDKKTHYVLIVGGRKYELRLHGAPPARGHNKRDKHDNRAKHAYAKRSDKVLPSANDGTRLWYNTSPVSIHQMSSSQLSTKDDEHIGVHTRRLWDPKTQIYVRTLYDVLLIGWTTATAEEIDYICTETINNWTYSRFVNTSTSGNCQNFVRLVADRICQEPAAIITDRSRKSHEALTRNEYHAASWAWFRHDVFGPIQQAEYSNRRKLFLRDSLLPSTILNLRSPVEAGSEITRFIVNFQRWTACEQYND